MNVATLGMVSKVEEYVDKKSGELIRTAFVASGEHMISVKLGASQEFAEMDIVVVAGELKSFERRFYINGGQIRLASPEDIQFLRGGGSTVRVNAAAAVAADPAAVNGSAGGKR